MYENSPLLGWFLESSWFSFNCSCVLSSLLQKLLSRFEACSELGGWWNRINNRSSLFRVPSIWLYSFSDFLISCSCVSYVFVKFPSSSCLKLRLVLFKIFFLKFLPYLLTPFSRVLSCHNIWLSVMFFFGTLESWKKSSPSWGWDIYQLW